MKLQNLTHMLIGILCIGLLADAQAVVPPPDGGYPNFTTAEGQKALFSLTTGSANTAVGWRSLFSNTAGSFNTATGAGTLLFNTGDENTAFGAAALLLNTTGSNNTAVGATALLNNTAGVANTATGVNALGTNSTGNFNTANGFAALYDNTDGAGNTATGVSALQHNTTGGLNTAIGGNALLSNTEGTENTATGANALFSNIDGDSNTANGSGALQNNTVGAFNTAIGKNALNHNTGSGNTGNGNTASGAGALENNTTGSFNTALGENALLNNMSGDENIAIGLLAGGDVTTADNVICIGATVAGANVNNSCYIGNIFSATSPSGTAVFVNSDGKLGTSTSSKRFKEHIKPMEQASEALFALKPVTFHYKKEIDPAGTPQLGLVAEDVEKINPDLIVRDKEGKPYSVRYDQVNAMLLNEFLKEHRKNEEQQKQINVLTAQLKEQAAQIQKVSAQLAAASPSDGGLEASKPAPQVVNNP